MKTDNFFWGLFFILIGGLILAVNFGYVDNSAWRSLLNLWPLFLVIIGLRIVLTPNNPFYIFLVLVIFVLAFLYATNAFSIKDKVLESTDSFRAENIQRVDVSLDNRLQGLICLIKHCLLKEQVLFQ